MRGKEEELGELNALDGLVVSFVVVLLHCILNAVACSFWILLPVFSILEGTGRAKMRLYVFIYILPVSTAWVFKGGLPY